MAPKLVYFILEKELLTAPREAMWGEKLNCLQFLRMITFENRTPDPSITVTAPDALTNSAT